MSISPDQSTLASAGGYEGTRAPTRNQILTLAALLTATVLTGFVALSGLSRAPVAPPAPVTIVQSPQPTPAPAPPVRVEPGD